MTLWLALALMTATAIFAVLWPLARREGKSRSGSDVAVYRDQLDEIDRDRAAGLIEDKEAAAARTEVSRRPSASARLLCMNSGCAGQLRRGPRVLSIASSRGHAAVMANL